MMMNSQELNKFIKENVDKIYDEMVKVRRTIHENPELGDEEFETSKLIKRFLTENGIEFFEVINTGVVATIYNDKENMENKINIKIPVTFLSGKTTKPIKNL